ncbi:MAG: hypothetical protein KAX80_14835, partial [Planctomycetes bacterium]|nr:hypothetical protein [Planctomycetota bacterium]
VEKKRITTSVDRMMAYIQKQTKVRSEKCAKDLEIPVDQIEEWADVLEEKGLINVDYSPIKGMVLRLKKTIPKIEITKRMEEIKWKKKPKGPGIIQRLKIKFARPEKKAKELRKLEDKILEKLETSYDLLDEIEKKQKIEKKKKKPKEAQKLKKKRVEIEKKMQKVRKEIREIEKAPRKEIKKRRFLEFMRKAEKKAKSIEKETDEFTNKIEDLEKMILKHVREH